MSTDATATLVWKVETIFSPLNLSRCRVCLLRRDLRGRFKFSHSGGKTGWNEWWMNDAAALFSALMTTEAIHFVSVDIYRHSFIFKTTDSTRLPPATCAHARMPQMALKPYHAPLLFYTTVKSLIIPSACVLACFRLFRKVCDLKVNGTIYHRRTRCLYPWWQLLLACLAGLFCVYLPCSTGSRLLVRRDWGSFPGLNYAYTYM